MTKPQLDDRIRTNLGKDVEVFAEPQKLQQTIAIMGLFLVIFVMIGYLDGSILPEDTVFFVLGLPILLGITHFVGKKMQFHAPYLAVGQRGVAFPLACREVIPWSNIASIKCYPETTFHGRQLENHVAVALELKSGTLADYNPTWRSRIPLFGYRSHFLKNVVLLSTIYCSMSPDEVHEILTSDLGDATDGPAAGSQSKPTSKTLYSPGKQDGVPIASVPRVPRKQDQPGHLAGQSVLHYACYSLIILAVALSIQPRDGGLFNSLASPQEVPLPKEIPANGMLAKDAGLTQEASKLLTGNGAGRNLTRAMELYREAADLGDPEAMNALGLIYAEGDASVRDPHRAYDWFKRAADAGSSDGIANIGWVYQEGIGVAKDYNLAFLWYRKAADLGNGEALNRLGLLYVDGLGTDKDPVAALRLFEKSAEKKNSNAIDNLGWLYRDAIGVPQDFAKARGFFERAADMGNEVSAWSLSVMIDEGKGGPFDPKAAAARLLQAAAAGQTDAIKELAGTMQHWQASTRAEVKILLAEQGLYNGPLDDLWDDRAQMAASRVVSQAGRSG